MFQKVMSFLGKFFKSSLILVFAVSVFVILCYFIYDGIVIEEQKILQNKELISIRQNEIDNLKIEYDKYKNDKSNSKATYMEEKAFNDYEYCYPGEIRFIDGMS